MSVAKKVFDSPAMLLLLRMGTGTVTLEVGSVLGGNVMI